MTGRCKTGRPGGRPARSPPHTPVPLSIVTSRRTKLFRLLSRCWPRSQPLLRLRQLVDRDIARKVFPAFVSEFVAIRFRLGKEARPFERLHLAVSILPLVVYVFRNYSRCNSDVTSVEEEHNFVVNWGEPGYAIHHTVTGNSFCPACQIHRGDGCKFALNRIETELYSVQNFMPHAYCSHVLTTAYRAPTRSIHEKNRTPGVNWSPERGRGNCKPMHDRTQISEPAGDKSSGDDATTDESTTDHMSAGHATLGPGDERALGRCPA